MASVPGRGSAGISTSGPENTKSVLSRPDIAGGSSSPYRPVNNGIKIKFTSSPKKTKINNPKI